MFGLTVEPWMFLAAAAVLGAIYLSIGKARDAEKTSRTIPRKRRQL
jgi:hypothetical protein